MSRDLKQLIRGQQKYTPKDYNNISLQSTNCSRKQSMNPKLAIMDLLERRQTSQDHIKRQASPEKQQNLSKVYSQIALKLQTKHKTEESKSTMPTNSTYDTDIELVIQQEETVSSLIAVVNKKLKVIKLSVAYFDTQQNCDSNPILAKSLLLEKISILVVLFEAISDNYDHQLQNIKNLLYYVHNNMIIHLQLIQSKNKLLTNRLHKLKHQKANKIPTDINQISKINNVIHSLLILFIESSKNYKNLNLLYILNKIDTLSFAQTNKLICNTSKSILADVSKIRLSKELLQTETDLSISQVPTKNYTLVIDLDETLVHYQELPDEGQFLVRPYAEQFLVEMGKYYEIVIFTASLEDYADYILDLIDKSNVIAQRFYRQHTKYNNGVFVKDLLSIDKNLNTTIIIDNLPENFKNQIENGIGIQSWYGEPEDRALYQLAPILINIVKKGYKDVRVALREFRNKMIQNIENGIEEPHLHII